MEDLHLDLPQFRHIPPLQSSFHEHLSEPSYQTKRCCKSYATQRKGGDQRLPIALKCIHDNSETGKDKRQETPCLCAGEGSSHGEKGHIMAQQMGYPKLQPEI